MQFEMERSVAIMQPYLFPYLGYFQLIQASDVFVFYDDVNFIKQGWINRNSILQNEKPLVFTIPLKKVSSFSKINEVEVNMAVYKKWERKFWKTIAQSYSKAPYYPEVLRMLEGVLKNPTSGISDLACESILLVLDYLGISKEFKYSSKHFPFTMDQDRADRIVSITNKLNSNHYVNRMGGRNLYDKDYFTSNGIHLSFIQNELPEYRQFSSEFVEGLSIIDVLMFNSRDRVKQMLNHFQLV